MNGSQGTKAMPPRRMPRRPQPTESLFIPTYRLKVRRLPLNFTRVDMFDLFQAKNMLDLTILELDDRLSWQTDPGFTTFVLKFKTPEDAETAELLLCHGEYAKGNTGLIVERLPPSPIHRNVFLDRDQSLSPATLPPLAANIYDGSNGSSANSRLVPEPMSYEQYANASNHPSHDLSSWLIAEQQRNAHSANVHMHFGNHGPDRMRMSSRNGYDEASGPSNDAFTETNSKGGRRATEPQALADAMSTLNLDTNNTTASASAPSPYGQSISARPFPTPNNGNGYGRGYPQTHSGATSTLNLDTNNTMVSTSAPSPYGNSMSSMSNSQYFPPNNGHGQGYMNTYHSGRMCLPPSKHVDKNPPCDTLYVGNLPMTAREDELRSIFSSSKGYNRLSFNNKDARGPMCFVLYNSIKDSSIAMGLLNGTPLTSSLHRRGIRLSFSKNSLGVKSNATANPRATNGMNGMGANGFKLANGPPPGLQPPPGLGHNLADHASQNPNGTHGNSPKTPTPNGNAYSDQSVSSSNGSRGYGLNGNIHSHNINAYDHNSNAYGGASSAYNHNGTAYGHDSNAYGGASSAYNHNGNAYDYGSNAHHHENNAYGRASSLYNHDGNAHGHDSSAYDYGSSAYHDSTGYSHGSNAYGDESSVYRLTAPASNDNPAYSQAESSYTPNHPLNDALPYGLGTGNHMISRNKLGKFSTNMMSR